MLRDVRDEIETIITERYSWFRPDRKEIRIKAIAKAIEERLTELGYVRLSELVLDGSKILELLSDIEHTRWSGWQAYLHSKCKKNDDGSLTIPAGYVKNLERLIATSYSNLTDKEKKSDREEARTTINALSTAKGIIKVKE